jgi:hypothetical protein
MEPIIGVVVAFSISLGLRFYFRYFAAEGVRVLPFEQWCRSRPVVAAFRCAPGTSIDVYEGVRRVVEPVDVFLNSSGRFPWQHYAVSVDCSRVSDSVIVLHVTGCRQLKVRDQTGSLPAALVDIGRVGGPRIEEVWLHGQLHAINRVIKVERENAAWSGTFAEDGAPDVAAMIGQPPWLAAAIAG